MSEVQCVFNILELSVDVPKEQRYDCGGSLRILSSLRDWERPAYGTAHSVDTLMMRGGIFIDWSDEKKSSEVLSMNVCNVHESKLLTDWKKNSFGNKYTHGKLLTCSLPQKGRPVSHTRLSKAETLAFISSTSKFCHVGSGVCPTHQKALRAGNWGGIVFESGQIGDTNDSGTVADFEEDMHADDNGNDLLYQFNDDEPGMDDNASIFTLSEEFDESIDEESAIRTTEKNTEDEKNDAIHVLCSYYGLTRLKSERNWCEMRPDTQRKKVALMIKLQDQLYKECVGDSWIDMKKACLDKMGAVERDSRVESIMDTVGQCLEECNDKSVRISVLKLLTGLFSEKEIRAGTGASRYLIRQAKTSSFEEVRALRSFKRVRYNEDKVLLFLRFLARPEILITLPNASKKIVLTNGDDVAIAAVARHYSYREIFALFGQYCEELGRLKGLTTSSDVAEFVRVHALGYSTAYKLMEILTPNRQLRMSCVDTFQASAYDAFEEFTRMVDELSLLDELDQDKTIDMKRRIRVSKNFIFGEMRSHISKESSVVNHCWTNALSDDNNSLSSLLRALILTTAISLPSIMKRIVEGSRKTAVKNKHPIRYRFERMLQICEESEGLILAYRQHLFRCVSSEFDRRQIIDGLEDGHALIVADYAMKLLPTDSIERQSQWYAKAGISYHMCATIARINGQLVAHSFSHVSAVSKQDSLAVAGILMHTLKILKENGVTHVHIRSDNAATYHSAPLIAFLLHLSAEPGMTILSHIFSEAQFGKGRADREISLSKGKLNSYIDSGHSACTPDEIIAGFTHNILLKGSSYYLIEVSEVEESNASVPGIKSYSSFRFEKDVGVRMRRHDAIGVGILVTKDQLSPFTLKYTIHREAGYLSTSEHFWKVIGSSDDVAINRVEEAEVVEEEDQGGKRYHRCPDMQCRSRFTTLKGMELHVERGSHSYFKETHTIVDYAARSFSNLVESTEDAKAAVHSDSIVPLTTRDQLEEGWALRENEKNRPLDREVRDQVESMIREKINGDRRAEAKEIKDQLRELKLPNGSYRFTIEQCLSESQIKSQITRVLNQMKKEKESEKCDDPNERVISTSVPTTSGRKRKESQPVQDVQKKKRGRPSKKVIEKIQENEEDNLEKEANPGDEQDEKINSLEIIETIVKDNFKEIFNDENSDEFEEEL